MGTIIAHGKVQWDRSNRHRRNDVELEQEMVDYQSPASAMTPEALLLQDITESVSRGTRLIKKIDVLDTPISHSYSYSSMNKPSAGGVICKYSPEDTDIDADAIVVPRKFNRSYPVSEPIQEEPIQEEPIQEEPIQEEPIQEEPIQEEPIQEEPIQEEPIQEEPIQEEPIQEEPIQEEPIQEEPIQEEPIQEEPIQEEPIQEEPIQTNIVVPTTKTKKQPTRRKKVMRPL